MTAPNSISLYQNMQPVQFPSQQVILSCLFLASLKFKQSSFVSVPVCIQLLLDNFKEVKAVRRGAADIIEAPSAGSAAEIKMHGA